MIIKIKFDKQFEKPILLYFLWWAFISLKGQNQYLALWIELPSKILYLGECYFYHIQWTETETETEKEEETNEAELDFDDENNNEDI